MSTSGQTVKKSVTIDRDVLAALEPHRRANLSATVNESLRLATALDKQRALVSAGRRSGDIDSLTRS